MCCFFPPDIDLNDPEVQAAAAKIQAGFRGHMTRKEIPLAKAPPGGAPGNGAPQESPPGALPPSEESNRALEEEMAAIDLTDPGGWGCTVHYQFCEEFKICQNVLESSGRCQKHLKK